MNHKYNEASNRDVIIICTSINAKLYHTGVFIMKRLKNRIIKACSLNRGNQTFSIREVVNLLSSINELEGYDISFEEYIDGTIELNIGCSTYYIADVA